MLRWDELRRSFFTLFLAPPPEALRFTVARLLLTVLRALEMRLVSAVTFRRRLTFRLFFLPRFPTAFLTPVRGDPL